MSVWNSLKQVQFELVNEYTKKHVNYEIYAVKLPIPPKKKEYRKNKQEFMFFAIEHYFPIEFLKENQMVKETDLPNVYEIKSKKTSFAKKVRKEKDVKLFEDFKCLFQVIDNICGEKTEFII